MGKCFSIIEFVVWVTGGRIHSGRLFAGGGEADLALAGSVRASCCFFVGGRLVVGGISFIFSLRDSGSSPVFLVI